MIPDQFRIVDLFCKALDTELTINQIAKLISKSYAFTNKYTHELIRQDILKTKVIGSAILCSLNFNNPKTIAILTYNSMIRGKETSKQGLVIIKIKNKTITINSVEKLKKILTKTKLSHITILKGHEIFWRAIAQI